MLSKVRDIDVFRVGKETRRRSDIELYPKVYTSPHLIYLNKQITAMCRRCGASGPSASWQAMRWGSTITSMETLYRAPTELAPHTLRLMFCGM